MNMYEENELDEYVNDRMIKQYQELFYYFNKQNNYCKICNNILNMPLEIHLIILLS